MKNESLQFSLTEGNLLIVEISPPERPLQDQCTNEPAFIAEASVNDDEHGGRLIVYNMLVVDYSFLSRGEEHFTRFIVQIIS